MRHSLEGAAVTNSNFLKGASVTNLRSKYVMMIRVALGVGTCKKPNFIRHMQGA